MKAILTIILIVLFGVIAIAQEEKASAAALPAGADMMAAAVVDETRVEVATDSSESLARLYRFKFSKVYKELSFNTRDNAPKLV
jgi:hypothetical protein